MNCIKNFNALPFADRCDLVTEHGQFAISEEVFSSNGRRYIIHLYELGSQMVEVWFNADHSPNVIRMISYSELDRFIKDITIKQLIRTCL
jgi:hypothetical protein